MADELVIPAVRNNSQIFPMGAQVPIMNYEVVDKKRFIWKGELILNINSKASDSKVIYFSREYQPEINELDKIFKEILFEDAELLGVPFLLVPKEKLLFAFEAGSNIISIPRNLKLKRPNHLQ